MSDEDESDGSDEISTCDDEECYASRNESGSESDKTSEPEEHHSSGNHDESDDDYKSFEPEYTLEDFKAGRAKGVGKVSVSQLRDEDSDIDVDSYPLRKNSIYVPPLPPRKNPLHKKKQKHKNTQDWDFDFPGERFVMFPSDWTKEDEKIFRKYAYPEYKANLKNRMQNMADVYQVPNTWRKKVYGPVSPEEFGKPREDPVASDLSGRAERNKVLENTKLEDIYVNPLGLNPFED